MNEVIKLAEMIRNFKYADLFSCFYRTTIYIRDDEIKNKADKEAAIEIIALATKLNYLVEYASEDY